MNETLQIFLSEPGKNHLKPFSNLLVRGKLLFGASNDGRLFKINSENYQILSSFSLHNSWISCLDATDDYLLTSSYDGTVSLFDANDIMKNDNSSYIQQNLHNDYILSCSLMNNYIVTASSEPSILISQIDQAKSKAIHPIHRIQNMVCSCHSLCSDVSNSIVYCGFSDGTLHMISLKDEKYNIQQIKFQASCIKALQCNNDNTLCVGDLDGSVYILDTRNYQEIMKLRGESRVLSIQKQKDRGYFVYFSDGSFIDTNTKNEQNDRTQILNANITAIYRENQNVFHVCDAKGTLHRLENGKETHSIKPSVSCKKICRLPQSTDFLIRYSDKSVVLMDGSTLEIKEEYGNVIFNDKLKELSSKPNLYFPVSFDVTTGIPKIIISNFVPKIVHPALVNERKYLSNFVKALIAKKSKVVCVNTSNIPIWYSRADQKLPNWMRYAIDPRLPYE